MINERRDNRDIIAKEAPPGTMKFFKFEIELSETLKKVKEWIPIRRWLKKNDVDFENYPEEIEF